MKQVGCGHHADDSSGFRIGGDQVRVIHGKGTGALRNAVRETLATHPLVREQSPAPQSEGGDGATIVTL